MTARGFRGCPAIARVAGRIPPRYTAAGQTHGRTMAAVDSNLRVVIAGAGGRMGRTLIHAVAATKGATLAGAVDAPDSAVIGRDAGELAGLGRNGVVAAADPPPMTQSAAVLNESPLPAPPLASADPAANAGLTHIPGT